MTNREREILEIIKKQPDIEQSKIASRSDDVFLLFHSFL